MLYALTAYLIILVTQPHGAPLKMVEEYPSLDACHEAVIKDKIRLPHTAITRRAVPNILIRDHTKGARCATKIPFRSFTEPQPRGVLIGRSREPLSHAVLWQLERGEVGGGTA